VFHPDASEIPAGATVTWVNDGRNAHTVTADDGSFDSGEIPPGRTFTLTFDEPTSVAYYCRYHSAPGGLGMSGRLVIGGGLPGAGGTLQAEPPRAGWMAGVLIVPIVGPIGYFALGRSPIPGLPRLVLVAGGLVLTWPSPA
jgi:hypothetical protein